MSQLPERTGWVWLTATTLVHNGPTLLWGLIVNANQKGGYVIVYDGWDRSSGRQVIQFQGADEVSNVCVLSRPILLTTALYVDFASHVDGCLVLYEPLMND
jgi:hypothetical protein